MLIFLQWSGCATGVLSAFLMSLNHKHSRWAFVGYIISNVLWISFGIYTHAPGLVAMEILFTVINMVGINQWLMAPKKHMHKDHIHNKFEETEMLVEDEAVVPKININL